jgi:outer membrane protein assembly factor BamB
LAEAGCCFLFLGLLAVYHFQNRPRFAPDPTLVAELADAVILEDEALPAADSDTSPQRPPGLPAFSARRDWPQWRGPRRDGVSTETGLLSDWPEKGPPEVWRVKGGSGYSAVVVNGGRTFTMVREDNQEIVVCWDAATGKERWRFPYDCPYSNGQGSGPRSTPAVDGDLIYTVGATGLFHCLETATGKRRWRHDLLGEFKAHNLGWGVSFSPLVAGDLVFTMPGGPDGYSLAAFNKRSGDLVWKGLADPAGYSSPLAITAGGVRQIVFFTGHSLVGVTPQDGKLLWRFPWRNPQLVNAATPIFFRARLGGGVGKPAPGGGEGEASSSTEGRQAGEPATTGGNAVGDYLFISSDYGKGCALLKVSGNGKQASVALVYEGNQMQNHFASSVLYRGHLYGFNDATLACLDVRTGKTLWKQRGFDKGSLLAADGRLYILGEHGKLALAEATPQEYRELSQFQPFRSRCWTAPVLADGKLYLRDEQEVLCLDLKKR